MSKIVVCGDLIYLCGQTAGGSDATDMAGQTANALRRVDALLEQAGSDKSRILSALIHIKSMDEFAAMNAVWDDRVPAGAAPGSTQLLALAIKRFGAVACTAVGVDRRRQRPHQIEHAARVVVGLKLRRNRQMLVCQPDSMGG